ncbi:hypothetical protein [aff. Roholtiella sp. LEGE 12411]|uniref:hypothetical protein n=1 Tax=aff. Roholtiella sp. LEGE 12411 TaxID=1828822 RepID=UPI0018803850|nr:hypothetical protein [aff. Roholtiella sp. LEGE 12411]MBE9038859.1 hypothetical protein [aff. Roholtiella sp. LEGE 12411]
MKFGQNKSGEFYAADYVPESGRVEVVDTDQSLEKLLNRHNIPEDDTELPQKQNGKKRK